jgi:hypothetical protein
MRLNLGANDRRVEGFISVDIAPPADQIVDLEGPWPWRDSSIEDVVAFDVAEHIGDNHNRMFAMDQATMEMRQISPLGRIHFMNELHRVLQPGGRATIEVPNAAKGVGFVCDPTHKTPWCLSTFKYFEAGTFAHGRLSKSYGITASFRVVKLEEIECSGEDPRERVWKIKATLEAVK